MPAPFFVDMWILGASHPRRSAHRAAVLLAALCIAAAGCTSPATPTFFLPPTSAPPAATAVVIDSPSPAEGPTAAPSATPLALTPTPCTNNLSYVQDLTVPDGAPVPPGRPVDKQWLVSNSGTCDWNAGYRLRLMTGEPMQAVPEQALFPARAGSQATLRIVFVAPQEPGSYQTAWQAVAPDGVAFGDTVYMQISVAP